jgi:drug/metabolite transporter (DMT)-like permease
MTQRDRIALLVLGMLWGASFLFMRIAAPELGAVPVAEIRAGAAALMLLAILGLRGGLRGMSGKARALLTLGAINSALPFALFAFATIHITAGMAAVLNATAPMFGALVAHAWLRDRLTPLRVIGLVVGFAGIVVLFWDELSVTSGATWAVVAALVASLSYGVGANYIRKRLGNVPPLAAATGSTIAATLLLLPLSVAQWPSGSPSLSSWASAIALGVLCTGPGYLLYFRLITRVGPAQAISVGYLFPVFGILWGFLFLGEPVTVDQVIVCAVILLGTGLASGALKGSRPSQAGHDHDTRAGQRAS